MDKNWIRSNDKLSIEYTNGVSSFITLARGHLNDENKTRCPCTQCVNFYYYELETVERHLWVNGFSKSYTNWVFHGEDKTSSSFNVDELESDINEDAVYSDDDDDDDDMLEAIQDVAGGINFEINQDDGIGEEESNYEPRKFKELFEEANKELYPGCSKVSALTFVVQMMHVKVLNKFSIKAFEQILKIFRDVLPNNHNIPMSHYEAKRILRKLGLGYETIHVCENDCTLFWKEHKDATKCPICGFSRYKLKGKRKKNVPVKKCITSQLLLVYKDYLCHDILQKK